MREKTSRKNGKEKHASPSGKGSLLAVDVGLSMGLALFDKGGRLKWFRSRRLSSTGSLKRIVHGILEDLPGLAWLVLEGGGPLANVWAREARRREISVLEVCAEVWREKFLYPRERRSGSLAKDKADALARRIITWSGAPRPTSLRHHAAESILVGMWAVLELGWLKGLPAEIRR
jgi:hypothetical protein